MRTKLALALLAITLAPAFAWSHDEKKDKPHGPNSFLVVFSHSRGSILEGTDFRISGFGLEYEDRWAGRLLGLSGYSLGARKDDLYVDNSGYSLNAKFFTSIGLAKRTSLSLGAGAEWSIPSRSYSASRYDYDSKGNLESWERTFPKPNAWAPHGSHANSTLNPMFEVRVTRSVGRFPLFVGAQARPMFFGTDTYTARTNSFTRTDERKWVFSVVAGFGVSH